jgi:hypothetical protein
MWFKVGVLFVLSYLVIGNNAGYSQNNLVKGKVLDAEMNSPLPGANVFLKGNSTIGATTDLDGNFLIKIPAGDQILVFSYLGFKDLEKEIKGGKDENISLVIKMESDAVMGQQVLNIVNQRQDAGSHKVNFSIPTQFSAGMYIGRLVTEKGTMSSQIIVR